MTITEDSQTVEAAVIAAGLSARYAQSHRRYHTRVHVDHVLQAIDELSPEPSDRLALQLAVWFHDAIYAPGRTDNEERSAHLAVETLEVIGVSPDVRREVSRLITLTATHLPDAGDEPGAVLCDADLSILASPREQYAKYARWIREEYELIPDDDFRSGRAAILRRFLERPTVFHTDIGRSRWESAARSNIRNEIENLEAAEQ